VKPKAACHISLTCEHQCSVRSGR